MTRRTGSGAVARVKPVDWLEIASHNPDRRELPPMLRTSEKAGTVIGRLNLLGHISDDHYEAARRYAVIVGAFLRLAGAPVALSGNAHGRASQCLGAYPCEAVVCSCQEIEDRYRSANFVLMAKVGYRGYAEVYRTAINDRGYLDIHILRLGLDALANHFGLTNQGKRRTH